MVNQLEAHGLDLPVNIGLAGPASPATLAKFALRCGVGASLRSLRDHIGRFGRLLMDDGPDEVLRGLWTSPSIAKAPIAGLHFFPFGGLSKTSRWLHDFDSRRTLAATRARPSDELERASSLSVATPLGSIDRRTWPATFRRPLEIYPSNPD